MKSDRIGPSFSCILGALLWIGCLLAVAGNANAQSLEGLHRLDDVGPTEPGAAVGRTLAFNEDATYLAVSAPGIGPYPGGQGAVWLYRRAVSAYVPVDEIRVQDFDSCDSNFGASLVWSGDQLLVGSPGTQVGRGAVYVFSVAANGAALEQTLQPASLNPGSDNSATFGRVIVPSASGARIWVSAPGHDGVIPNAGRIYGFDRVGTHWVEASYWDNLDTSYWYCGYRMARCGNQLVMGTVAGLNAHLVLDILPSGALTFRELVPEMPGSWNGYGKAVAATEDEFFVCNPLFGYAPFNRLGEVGVYRRDSSGSLALAQVIRGVPLFLNPTSGDNFGYSIAVDGDRLVVGANFAWNPVHGPNYGGSGVAYVFDRDSQGWALERAIQWRETDDVYAFGESVAVRGSHIAIGATSTNTNFASEGAAFVTSLRLGDEICSATCGPVPTATPGRLRLFGHPNADLQNLELRADRLPVGANGVLFLASLGGVVPPTPALSAGCLCLGGTIQRLAYVSAPGGTAQLEAFSSSAFPFVGPSVASTTYFQAWYRDLSSGASVNSRFSNAIALEWQ